MPHLLLQLDQGIGQQEKQIAWEWLEQHAIRVLNVAGPRESKRPHIYRVSYEFLASLMG